MMKRMILAASVAALLAVPTVVSAQVWDGPRGSAVYSYDDGAGVTIRTHRWMRPDNPPGSSFQDRGIDEDLGRSPLNRGYRLDRG
jgi:hypothetical protein